jgi:hypothetical protein
MRWENVRELITFASQVDHEQAGVTEVPDFEDEENQKSVDRFSVDYYATGSKQKPVDLSLEDENEGDTLAEDQDLRPDMTYGTGLSSHGLFADVE